MNFDDALRKAEELIPKGSKLLFLTKHGSHLYGLDTPESDVDLKGVYLPSKSDMLLKRDKRSVVYSTGNDHSKNSSEDFDIELFSVQEFFRLLSRSEMITIDMLFAHSNPDAIVFQEPIFKMLLGMHRKELSSNDYTPYVGYIMNQVSKYGLKGSRMGCLKQIIDSFDGIDSGDTDRLADHVSKLPLDGEHTFTVVLEGKNGDDVEFLDILGKKYQLSITFSEFKGLMMDAYDRYGARAKRAMKNDGVDWKAVSHAFRAAYQLKMIDELGEITFPFVGDQRITLIETKLGMRDWTDVKGELETLVREVKKISTIGTFDSKVADSIILRLYQGL